MTLTLTLALTLTPTLTRCATACEPSPLKRITYRACPVHTSDKSKFVGAKKTLESHSFGHGRSVLDFEARPLLDRLEPGPYPRALYPPPPEL